MRKVTSISLTAVALILASPCFGQATGPGPSPGTPGPGAAAMPEQDRDNPPVAEMKRQACRQEGMGRSMRGPDLQDYVAVCVMEARLTCLKQAVAQKVRGPERRDFMSKCMAS